MRPHGQSADSRWELGHTSLTDTAAGWDGQLEHGTNVLGIGTDDVASGGTDAKIFPGTGRVADDGRQLVKHGGRRVGRSAGACCSRGSGTTTEGQAGTCSESPSDVTQIQRNVTGSRRAVQEGGLRPAGGRADLVRLGNGGVGRTLAPGRTGRFDNIAADVVVVIVEAAGHLQAVDSTGDGVGGDLIAVSTGQRGKVGFRRLLRHLEPRCFHRNLFLEIQIRIFFRAQDVPVLVLVRIGGQYLFK